MITFSKCFAAAVFCWVLAFVPQSRAGEPVGSIRVNFMATRNYTQAELKKLFRAADLLEQVISSEEFKRRILSYNWNGTGGFANHEGLSNQQVYAKIMAGQESYSNHEDHTVDLSMNMYYSRKKVVGYTYPNSSEIYQNRRYFRNFTAAEVAANLVHEWTHKLGFDHDFDRTARRPYSVPYAVGSLVYELAEKLE